MPLVTVKRYVKRFRQGGPKAFFVAPAKRNGSKLTPDVLAKAQELLHEGLGVPEIALALGVLPSTLHKAIKDGRLSRPTAQKKRTG